MANQRTRCLTLTRLALSVALACFGLAAFASMPQDPPKFQATSKPPKGIELDQSLEIVQNERKAFEGNWGAVACEIDGVKGPFPDDYLNDDSSNTYWCPVFKGDQMLSLNDVESGEGSGYQVILNPNASPKQFDLIESKSGAKGIGIYKIDGDELTTCINLSEKNHTRPSQFSTRNKDDHVLVKYRRRSKKGEGNGPINTVSAVDDHPKRVAEEIGRFRGKWTCIGIELNGLKVPLAAELDDEAKRNPLLRPEFQSILWLDPKDTNQAFMIIEVDPEKEPKEITLVNPTGFDKMIGIYKLEGNELTICFTSAKEFNMRPENFRTILGYPFCLYRYKRIVEPSK